MKQGFIVSGALALCLATVGCAPPDVTLPGQRFDVRTPLSQTLAPEGGDAVVVTEAAAVEVPSLRVPAQRAQDSWTHRGGSVTHTAGNAQFAAQPTQIWATRIGAGDGKRARISADPVLEDGRVFAMGSDSTISAVNASTGGVIWSRNLTPASDRVGQASSGGISVSDGIVFVTTGFGELHAIDAATGAEKWVQDLDAGATGTPTVSGNAVYVVSRDARAWSINVETGRINWQVPGLPAQQVRAGGPGPIVTDRNVIFPFGSGEMIAVLKGSGIRAWAATVSGERRGRAFAGIDDVTGDPVLVDGVIYAGNPSGRIVALDASSGARLWTATDGALGTVVPIDNSVFAVSDLNALIRIDASTGETIWDTGLPLFTKSRIRRRKAITAQYGPVLAGDRLWVAGSDNLIRAFDPETGAEVAQVPLRGGAASAPIVANGTLYVVGKNGQLYAFR